MYRKGKFIKTERRPVIALGLEWAAGMDCKWAPDNLGVNRNVLKLDCGNN